MRFTINNRTWEIIELSKEEMDKEYPSEGEGEVYGLCDYTNQKICIWKDLHQEQKRQTLIHELTHCYIGCYMSFEDMVWHVDVICNLVGNSHDIIHEIVENYFNLKKPLTNN